MSYSVWLEVIDDATDEKVGLGFARSAEFDDPDEAAEFASLLHELAELLKKRTTVTP